MVNKKGQVLFYSLMLGITILIVALSLAFPVKQQVDSIRNTTTLDGSQGLDCTNTSISNFDKGTCIVADLTIFHFVGGLIFIALAVLGAKIIFT
jgi:Trk-type K+ transport system membrane component